MLATYLSVHGTLCAMSYPVEIRSQNSLLWRLIGHGYLLYVAFFVSIVDLALGRIGLMPLQPTIVALLGAGAIGGLVILHALRERVWRAALIGVVVRSIGPIALYGGMALLSLLLSALPGAYWSEGGRWIFLLTYGFVLWFCVLLAMSVPILQTAARRGLLLGFLMLSASILYEVFSPGTFSNLTSRASGFAGNSNFGALSMSLLLAALLHYRQREKRVLDLTLIAIAGLAVLATQSRSGLVEYAIVVAVWGLYLFTDRSFSVKEALRLGGLGLLMFVLLALVLTFFIKQGGLFAGESSRLSRMLAGKSLDDGSGDERMQIAFQAIRIIEQSPILGSGTGYTRRMIVPPHNQYLQQWVNNGVLGLGMYVLLQGSALLIFLKRRYPAGVACMLVAVIGSCFSHNVLDQRTFICVFAILLGISAQLVPPVRQEDYDYSRQE